MSEKKLTIKVSQKINSIMNKVDKMLIDKYKRDKEFYAILIAPKDNPWMCEDIIIPKQKVTSASIIVPKEGMHAPYQKHFEEYILNNKSHVVVGTIHSHNSMNCFFSGGDDEDLDNNSCFNLNEGLPFIDIVWSNKDNSYKGRVRMKVGKGISKQIFTLDDCECILTQDDYTNMIIEKVGTGVFQEIDKLKNDELDIDKNKLEDGILKAITASIIPKMNFDEIMENIEVETYSYGGYNDYGSYRNSYKYSGNPKPVVNYTQRYLDKGGNVTVEIGEYSETDQMFSLKCKGEDKDITNFIDMIEEGIGHWYDRRCLSYLGDETTIELKCPSNKRYKKMRRRLESLYNMFISNGKKLESKIEEVGVPVMNDEEAYEAFHDGGTQSNLNTYKDMDYVM